MRYTLSPTVTLYHADCRDVLRSLPDNNVDSVPCDPPYELNFMGKGWDNTGIANDVTLWREVFRVLKPGGHVAAFSASRTYHRMACAIEDAGFEIRDSLMWIYGTGFPKSQNVAKFIDTALGAESIVTSERETGWSGTLGGKTALGGIGDNPDVRREYAYTTPEAQRYEGFGTALKPAFEPIVLARKPLSEPTVAANVLRWRTGALNIDGCRVEAESRPLIVGGNDKSKGTDGYGSISGGSRAAGETTQGRWPANVVTDGSDEVVGMFPSTKSGYTDGKKNGVQQNTFGKYGAGQFAESYGDSGSAARFFYSAKASKTDRNGSKHPTVKPISLMAWLARLITPPGGTILDPFAGSGTTGAAARQEGFAVILCEQEAEYVADIRRRFAHTGLQFDPAALAATIEAERCFSAWATRV